MKSINVRDGTAGRGGRQGRRGPDQMSPLTECCLCNIFKVEILGLIERLNSLRQSEREECCSLERGREIGWLPGGKGDGGEKDGGAN